MKIKQYLFLLLGVTLFSSCSIQKRLYRPGYSLTTTNSKKKSQEITTKATLKVIQPIEKNKEIAKLGLPKSTFNNTFRLKRETPKLSQTSHTEPSHVAIPLSKKERKREISYPQAEEELGETDRERREKVRHLLFAMTCILLSIVTALFAFAVYFYFSILWGVVLASFLVILLSTAVVNILAIKTVPKLRKMAKALFILSLIFIAITLIILVAPHFFSFFF